MNRIALYTIIFYALCFCSCGKKKIERTYYRTYPVNPFYTGSHPKNNLTATVYMIEKEGYLEFQVSMSGLTDSLSYKLHIHEQDTTQPFKYTGNPVLDFGELQNGQQVKVKEIATTDFDSFTQNFKGYFVVHDPYNIQNDTTTLLIYGKIGKEW